MGTVRKRLFKGESESTFASVECLEAPRAPYLTFSCTTHAIILPLFFLPAYLKLNDGPWIQTVSERQHRVRLLVQISS